MWARSHGMEMWARPHGMGRWAQPHGMERWVRPHGMDSEGGGSDGEGGSGDGGGGDSVEVAMVQRWRRRRWHGSGGRPIGAMLCCVLAAASAVMRAVTMT